MLYLIQDSTSKLIKIGISRNPEKRLKQLQTGTGSQLKLLRTFVTDNDQHWEKRLHKMFLHHRKKGEWFNLNPLSDYLSFFDQLLL